MFVESQLNNTNNTPEDTLFPPKRREFKIDFYFFNANSIPIELIKNIFHSKKTPDSVALSVVHLSPLGSQMSFAQPPTTRIENVADWEAIAKKYRALNGGDSEDTGSLRDSEDNSSHLSDAQQAAPAGAPAQIGNNVNAMGNQV